MRIFVKIILFLIALVIIVPVLLFQYFFNSGPRDLGVKYTPQNYTDAHNKIAVEVGVLESSSSVKDSLLFSGKKEINVNLDSSEVTAYLNAEKWVYAPLSNLQVKINSDGTAQASGIIDLNNVLPFISMTTPVDEVNKAIEKYKITSNPSFYANGKVSVINNKVNFEITSLEIAKISVPQNYVSENINAVNNFATDRLNIVPNLMVRKLDLSGGKVNIDATVPEKLSKLQK